MTQYERPNSQVQTATGLNILAGIWLLISPFIVSGFGSTSTANNVVCGIVIGLIATTRWVAMPDTPVPSWMNAILGLWVLVSPWLLGFSTRMGPTWNNVILGIIVVCLAVWAAVVTTRTMRPRYTGTV